MRAELELVSRRTQVGRAYSAQGIDFSHGFADDHIGRADREGLQRLFGPEIVEVGFIYPDPCALRRCNQNGFERFAPNMLAGGTVGIDQHD